MKRQTLVAQLGDCRVGPEVEAPTVAWDLAKGLFPRRGRSPSAFLFSKITIFSPASHSTRHVRRENVAHARPPAPTVDTPPT